MCMQMCMHSALASWSTCAWVCIQHIIYLHLVTYVYICIYIIMYINQNMYRYAYTHTYLHTCGRMFTVYIHICQRIFAILYACMVLGSVCVWVALGVPMHACVHASPNGWSSTQISIWIITITLMCNNVERNAATTAPKKHKQLTYRSRHVELFIRGINVFGHSSALND